MFHRSSTKELSATNDQLQIEMSAMYEEMTQPQLRAELETRGLIVGGKTRELKARLVKDDTRGAYRGDLDTLAEPYMRDGCKLLSINSSGTRQELVQRIEKYNVYKKAQMDAQEEEMKGSINADLPMPDDWLGEPTRKKILGTPGSQLHSKSYSRYLAKYKTEHGTTKDAWTLKYWRTLRYPHISPDKLWPVWRYDCRVETSSEDEAENEAQ